MYHLNKINNNKYIEIILYVTGHTFFFPKAAPIRAINYHMIVVTYPNVGKHPTSYTYTHNEYYPLRLAPP